MAAILVALALITRIIPTVYIGGRVESFLALAGVVLLFAILVRLDKS